MYGIPDNILYTLKINVQAHYVYTMIHLNTWHQYYIYMGKLKKKKYNDLIIKCNTIILDIRSSLKKKKY